MKNTTTSMAFSLGKAALMVLMLFFTATILNAQTVTFAQYTQRFGGQDFVFQNNGSSATFQTVTDGSPINFNYLNIPGLPFELRQTQNAHIYFSSTTTAPGLTTTGNRTIQPFNGVFNIFIYRDTPASVGTGTRTNLLTVTITPATSNPDLSGEQGAKSAGFTASTPIQNVTYTSDFISFNDTTDRNLTLGFTSITPLYTLGGTFLSSFNASGTGSFASNPPPLFTPPTAASVIVSGRVVSPKGRGVANTRVMLTDSTGRSLTAFTNNFGYYEFSDVTAGGTVVISVKSRIYSYAPQVLNLTEETRELIFSPQ